MNRKQRREGLIDFICGLEPGTSWTLSVVTPEGRWLFLETRTGVGGAAEWIMGECDRLVRLNGRRMIFRLRCGGGFREFVFSVGRKKGEVVTIVKKCACGLQYDDAAWAELPRVGTMPDGQGGTLELKNCTGCRSTMSVPVVRVRPWVDNAGVVPVLRMGDWQYDVRVGINQDNVVEIQIDPGLRIASSPVRVSVEGDTWVVERKVRDDETGTHWVRCAQFALVEDDR